MRRNDHMARRFLAVFLASVLAYGNFGIQVALGVEATGGSVDVAAQTLASDEKNAPAETDASVADDSTTEPADDAVEAGTQAAGDAAEAPIATQTDSTGDTPTVTTNDSDDVNVSPAAETQLPYSISVKFGGQELSDKDGENNFTDAWTTVTKQVDLVLTRDFSVPVDSTKQYVLCMSVPDTLYFGGTNSVSGRNGIEEVAMVQNAAPKVKSATGGTEVSLPDFSKYSGEIRARLNTAVDSIEIPGLDVNFDTRLFGYKVESGSTVLDALNIRIVEVDSSATLSSFKDKDATEVLSRKVDSLFIKNGGTFNTGSDIRMHLSTDGFMSENSISGSLNMGKSGSISYGLATSAATYQVYKTLKVVFSCPYIEVAVNGVTERHYLSFDEENDSALKSNKKGKQTGCKAASIEYDAANHTITYTFENAYLGQYQLFLLTPTFTWPSDLNRDSVTIPSNGLTVQRDPWVISEEEVYAGGTSTLLPAQRQCTGKATIIDDGANVQIQSSAEQNAVAAANKKTPELGKHVIYEGLTRENGATGALGFFDVHNKGVTDAPASTITFEFNTNSADEATYYVTRVNIPFDNNESGITVSYVLTNGQREVSGTRHFTNTSSCSLYASTLRSASGVSSDYYIKSISYEAATLRKNGTFHTDVAHARRNSTTDYGQFFGFMEGEVGSSASATMTIESSEPLNAASETKLTSTETSWVGTDDYIGVGLNANAKVGDGAQQGTSWSMTAGETATLTLSGYVTSDEYHGYNVVDDTNYDNATLNGYHVMRDPIVYVCLPVGVSIQEPGKAVIRHGVDDYGTEYKAESAVRLEGSDCTYNGISAVWWEIRFKDVNISSTTFRLTIEFATNQTMNGVSWGFEKAIAIRGDGQQMSWTSQTANGSVTYNTAAALAKVDSPLTKALAAGLTNDPHATDGKLGLMYYTYNVNTRLNITRAEAKLDVDTSMSQNQGAGGQKTIKVTAADSEINYDVEIVSNEGGYAKNFNYYIPVPKETSGDDANMFVATHDFSLALYHQVEISAEDSSGKAGTSGDDVFKVQYTTQEGLTSASVRSEGVAWEDSVDDLSKVTAVRISTSGDDVVINDGSSYKFHLTFKYQGNDFDTRAGQSVQWRSFGHYSYVRNGATTTNSYPSQDNSVKLGYVANLTGEPLVATLDTARTDKFVDVSKTLDQKFVNAQTMAVKKVTVSDGTTLISTSPEDLTGSSANSNFWMQFAGNGANLSTLSSSFIGGSFTVASNSQVSLRARTYFSKALTDVNTQRYVDVTFGNDDVDITVRVRLDRKVAAAEVDGSGTATGENFQTVTVDESSKTIASNAAFTALYDVKNFVPGNFTAQKLVWKAGDTAAALPAGTNITMMKLGSDNKVESWWLYTAKGNESTVILSDFKRMSGSDSFTYDISTTAAAELKYQFVVSLPSGGVSTGSYSLGFAADAKSGVAAFKTVDLPIVLAEPANFSLSVSGQTVTYTCNTPSYEDTRNSGKLLALVLTPKDSSVLPADAKVTAAGSDTPYVRNASGSFIVPLGTVDSGEKSVELGLVSDMASADGVGINCNFDVSLREFAGVGTSPMAGLEVGTGIVELAVSAGDKPALKVTGTRVAKLADWTKGQKFSFEASEIPDDATVTLTAYQGLTGSNQATDLLSSVGSFFDVSAAVGTWKDGRPTGDGTLILSSVTKAGTYRLVFEVKRGNDVLLTVPYYIVVRE